MRNIGKAFLIYLPVAALLLVAGKMQWLGSDTASCLQCAALAVFGIMLFGTRYAGVVALAIALVGVPALSLWSVQGADNSQQPLLSIEMVAQLGRFMCFAIVALGIDLVWGYTGILSLCQAMFFCFGGYCMGMYLALHGPLDGDGIPRCLYVVSSDVNGFTLPWFWQPFKTLPVTLILALLVPGISALIFGYFAFRSRVRGVYFSIITQATTFGAWLIFCRNSMRLCGTNGLTNFTEIAGFDLKLHSVKLGLYIISVLALVAVYFLCRHIVNSRLGRILIAIRDNESRLRFSGYQPLYFKVFIFALAALIAGIGGMLYTPQMGIITPANMGVAESIMMVIWVAVGGRGTLSGAIVGALVVNYMYNILTTQAPSSWPFVQGGLFIGVVLFFPDGLAGLWQRLISKPPAAGDVHLPPDDSETSKIPATPPVRAQEAKA